MRPLRVLHVTPYSADAWAYGGIPRLADALTRGLAKLGHDVTVCTTDACDQSSRLVTDAAGGRSRGWPASLTADGVTFHVLPNLSNRCAYHWQLFLPLGLGEYLRRSAASFDVAHLHACRNVPGAIAAHHLRRAGVPYVLAPNGTAPRIERRRFAKRVFDVAIGTRIVQGASRVIAVSDAERVQLRAIGVPPDAIRVVANPIDLDEFNPPPTRGNFRRRVGGRSGPLVLFLGRLTARKRVDVLVRAFARLLEGPAEAGHYVRSEAGQPVRMGAAGPAEAGHYVRSEVGQQVRTGAPGSAEAGRYERVATSRVSQAFRPAGAANVSASVLHASARPRRNSPDLDASEGGKVCTTFRHALHARSDAQLVIAGNDMGAARSARQLACALGVDDRTMFTGLLRGRDRLEALADTDVLVYPSQDEIFGLVPLEALLCGTPVIVADDSGCAEIVRAVGGGQIVPLGDVDALAAAIDRVLEHPAHWRAAAEQAAVRVRAAYARDVVCAELDDVYRELVEAG
jgi:glycosyltransferase involved in cell wall biosynthesis